MRNKLARLILLSLFPLSLYAQDKAPLLSGTVEISIKEGTFECDLTLTDIPAINDYFIRINSGMNLLHIRSREPEDFLLSYRKSPADSLATGEASAYYFPDTSGEGKFLPSTLQFRYVGKFPVVTDTTENFSRKDWKGNIAFNHNSVRTDGGQTAWYPILYDITNDKDYKLLRYDIEVTCSDCTSLYVNGSDPVKATTHNFKSDSPVELSLFCGNYDFSSVGSTYILNSDLDEEEAEGFGELIQSYKAFYEEKLGIPFATSISFVETTPTSLKDAWLFVSFPTIMSIAWNNGLKTLYDPENRHLYRPFIAHELGHYYFGNFKVFNSELGDMISEGFSEYMAMQLTGEILGQEVFAENIKRKLKNLKGFKATPIGKVKSASDYGNRQLYVYNYAPVIFTAIEQEIGEEKMWQWLHTLLSTPSSFTNYEFLISTLQSTLKDVELFEGLRSRYFESETALGEAVRKIEGQS